MAGEWAVVRLEDVCETITDGAHQSPKDCPGGLPMASVKDMARWGIDVKSSRTISHEDFADLVRNGCQPQIGDVLIAKDGATCLDTVCEFTQPDKIVLLSSVAILRPSRQLHSGYLRYYLDSAETRAMLKAGYVSGSAIPRVVLKDFRRAPIPLPPLNEQKAIAQILGTLDDKIELNQRMNATMEAMARAMFQSWFVDFDPVRAKLDGTKPIGLDAATAELFPAHFQISPLGHIPQGWEAKLLSEITTVITKGTTPTQEDITSASDTDAQINYVRVNSIDEDGSIIFDKLTKIPLSVHTGVLKRSTLRANDVLYTIAGTIGRIATAEDWFLPANTNQAVAIIRPKPTIPSGFLVLTMRHEIFRADLHNNIVHAVQANLSLGMLSKARVVVPPEDVLIKMFKPIDDIMSQISANRTQSRTLANLRDALLPKLLSGELSVAQFKQGDINNFTHSQKDLGQHHATNC